MNLNMLVKLSAESSIMVATSIDTILAAICPVYEKNVKVMAKSDRAEHITYAALRAFYAMAISEEVQANPNQKLTDFIEAKIKLSKEAVQLYEKISDSFKM